MWIENNQTDKLLRIRRQTNQFWFWGRGTCCWTGCSLITRSWRRWRPDRYNGRLLRCLFRLLFRSHWVFCSSFLKSSYFVQIYRHFLALSTSFNYKAVYEYTIYKKRHTRQTGIQFTKQIISNLYFLRLRFGLGLRSGSWTVRSSSGVSTGRSSQGTTTRTGPRLVRNLKKNVIYFHFLVSSKSSLYLRLAAIRPVL